ncbi:MAG TPA: condensation domain-containing protein [Terriglobia bacterium]|nr:condensation domain-containing protein [Terriglobia bacterium]
MVGCSLIDDQSYPLCLTQERVLLFRELARRRSETWLPSVLRYGVQLNGDWPLARIKSALLELLSRHPALCVVFTENVHLNSSSRARDLELFRKTGVPAGGYYVQSAVIPTDLPVHTVNLSLAADQSRALFNLVKESESNEFGLGESPRLRVTLAKTSIRHSILILSIDHIVSDGFSLGILREELNSLLTGCDNSTLPTPGFSYLEFAGWQSLALSENFFASDVLYWERSWAKFASARVAVGDLPFSLQSDSVVENEYDRVNTWCAEDESDAIRHSARTANITLFTFFLAALAVVLSEYTGKARIAVWCHFANRMRPHTGRSIGYFANTHLLGIDLSNHPTGAELLEQVSKDVLKSLAHQALPLPALWKALGRTPRVGDATVLLDIRKTENTFRTQDPLDASLTSIDVPGPVLPRYSKFGIYVTHNDKAFMISAEYVRSKFSRVGVEQFLKDLRLVLSSISANPNARVLGKILLDLPNPRRHYAQPEPMEDFIQF